MKRVGANPAHALGLKRSWQRKPAIDADYAYATGRVRVLAEAKVDREEERTFVAPGSQDLSRHHLLDTAGYPSGDSLEQRLLLGRDAADLLLQELSRHGVLSQGLLLERDYQNVKAMTKYLALEQSQEQDSGAAHRVNQSAALRDMPGQTQGAAQTPNKTEGGQQAERDRSLLLRFPEILRPLLMPSAVTPLLVLWDHLRRQWQQPQRCVETRGVDPSLAASIQAVHAAYVQHPEALAIDRMVDRLYFRHLADLAAHAGTAAGFLQDYTAIQSDRANLQILARCRAAQTGKAYYAGQTLAGGSLTEEAWAELYDADSAQLEHALSGSLVKDLLAYVNVYSAGGGRSFELVADQALERLAQKGQKASYGPDVIGAFWLGRMLEIKRLRSLLVALDLGLTGSEALQSLRPIAPTELSQMAERQVQHG